MDRDVVRHDRLVVHRQRHIDHVTDKVVYADRHGETEEGEKQVDHQQKQLDNPEFGMLGAK